MRTLREPRHAVSGTLRVQTREQIDAELRHRVVDERARLCQCARRNDISVAIDESVSSAQAAFLLGLVNEGTLRNWRCSESGPVYMKRGRQVRYRLTDLAEWNVRQRCG